MTTQDWLLAKAAEHGADFGRTPIEIPNVGRDDLAQWFADLGFKAGAEIGVKEGEYSAVLSAAEPRMLVHSIDPWLVREEYYDRRGQAVFTAYEQKAREVLARFPNNRILKEKSHEAARRFMRHELDFVYIDGHHNLFNVIRDIHEWSIRVRPGGIIACHDYVRLKNQAVHVVQAVQAYTDSYGIKQWFLLGRKNDPKRDKHRTALWVRPQVEANMRDYDPTFGGLVELPA